VRNHLGEVLSKAGLRQLRIAETEKYAHVTFFFNGGSDAVSPGEERVLIPSPKVATYDLKPEMAAAEVRDAVLRRLKAADGQSLIVVNFANPDMVGHTGSLPAAIQAVETVDACVGQIIDETLQRGGSLVITADHGNCEQMWDPKTNAPHTSHTTFDVPLFVVGKCVTGRRLRGDNAAAGWFRPDVRDLRGRLADIMPTVLEMMGLPQPEEMTGRSLLV
jgi:2,3-bisphosphoglycerate-independent phosphoglycerate mutase